MFQELEKCFRSLRSVSNGFVGVSEGGQVVSGWMGKICML